MLMDADLQDPPSLLPKMLHYLEEEGYDSVATRRVTRKGETGDPFFLCQKILCPDEANLPYGNRGWGQRLSADENEGSGCHPVHDRAQTRFHKKGFSDGWDLESHGWNMKI